MLIGFSGGAAFAGGLVLDDPARYAGAAILLAPSPSMPASRPTPARLALVPMFVVHGDQDHGHPKDLLESHVELPPTMSSGAPTAGHRDPGGHGITRAALQQLVGWLEARLSPAR